MVRSLVVWVKGRGKKKEYGGKGIGGKEKVPWPMSACQSSNGTVLAIELMGAGGSTGWATAEKRLEHMVLLNPLSRRLR